MIQTLAYILAQLVEHADVLELIFDAVKDGKLTKDEIKKAVKDSITAAYDIKVKAQMGFGP